MQLVIQTPVNKDCKYVVMHQTPEGICIATGYSFSSKAKALDHVRDLIFNSITSYDDSVIFWNDTDEAWENGTYKVKVKVSPKRTRKH